MPQLACFHDQQKRGLSQRWPCLEQLFESAFWQTTSSGAPWKAHDFAKISPRKTKFYLTRAKPMG